MMCLEITLNKLNEIIEQQGKRIKELGALEEENKRLEAEIKKLTSARKCSCGEDIYFYTYCPRCRKNWES